MKKNFYNQVKEKAKNKSKDQSKKTTKVEVVDEIEDGAGVYDVNGTNVQRGTRNEFMPSWVQSNAKWHINMRGGDRDHVYHVSREGIPMVQYYFTGTGADIVGVQPNAVERGNSTIKKDAEGDKVHTKRTFDDLPAEVQNFIRDNWYDILG
ncbi:MAG TPA: hypothetical protein VFX16_37220 [Pseudonocardiaceae bacterium]|nr:hypothetical protein [Pseudonocardiaceae bacterium]